MGEVRDMIMAEPLFGTHDHQGGFAAIESRRDEVSYRSFLGYAPADMATAGGAITDNSTPEEFFDTWQFVRTTGYGQGTELACREVLGLEFTRENADAITAALRERVAGRSGPQIYADLYELAGVKWVVNDACSNSPTDPEVFTGRDHPDFFGQALRYDAVIGMSKKEDLQTLEQTMDCSIQRLCDLEAALDACAERAREGGKLIAMKCGLAYLGELRFDSSSCALAERVFEDILQGQATDRAPLTSYLFHRFVQRARDFNVPVQIHTGYLAGNYCRVSQGDPTPLIPVLQRYKGVRFDLFHAGWPYSELMGAIGKTFPNVYLDMCWAWAMNPAAMERSLDEWLAAVPHNKIFAFGADTGEPYVVPGYAQQARNGIASVLERKVASGEYDTATACQVAARIMHDNAQELYRME